MKKLLFLFVLLFAAVSVFAVSAADIDAAKRAASKADLAFLWASDTHHNEETGHGAQKELIEEFVKTANGTAVDFAAVTGDLVHGKYSRESQVRNLRELLGWLREAGMPLLLTMGNHDDNSWYISGKASVRELGSTAELLPKEDFFRIVLEGREKEFVRDTAHPYGGWYYKDFSGAKVRVIVLNPIDIPYIPLEGGGLESYGLWNYGIRGAQLNWLANKALRFDKSGWAVMVMLHMDTVNTKFRNGDMIQMLLAAFGKNASGVISSDTENFETEVKYNFSRNGSNEVIGVFAGHTHKNQFRVRDGIPHIVISNICDAEKGGFDLVTVDRERRKISTMRFRDGARAPELDRIFVY